MGNVTLLPIQTKHILELVDMDAQKRITQADVDAYCNERGLQHIKIAELSDYVYEAIIERISGIIMPKVCEILSRVKLVRDKDTEDDKEAAQEHNEALRLEIINLFVEQEVGVRYIQQFAKVFSDQYVSLLRGAIVGLETMQANVLMNIADKHFGHDVTVKDISEYIAKIKAEITSDETTG